MCHVFHALTADRSQYVISLLHSFLHTSLISFTITSENFTGSEQKTTLKSVLMLSLDQAVSRNLSSNLTLRASTNEVLSFSCLSYYKRIL